MSSNIFVQTSAESPFNLFGGTNGKRARSVHSPCSHGLLPQSAPHMGFGYIEFCQRPFWHIFLTCTCTVCLFGQMRYLLKLVTMLLSWSAFPSCFCSIKDTSTRVKYLLILMCISHGAVPLCSVSEFAQLRPHLFARYIPNILPPTSESDLDKYIEETRQMQRDLMTHPLFTRYSLAVIYFQDLKLGDDRSRGAGTKPERGLSVFRTDSFLKTSFMDRQKFL